MNEIVLNVNVTGGNQLAVSKVCIGDERLEHIFITVENQEVKAYLHSERFRLKLRRESVTLRGFWLCCFSWQNFKWNPWLLMLFHMILDRPPTRLTIG